MGNQINIYGTKESSMYYASKEILTEIEFRIPTDFITVGYIQVEESLMGVMECLGIIFPDVAVLV